MTVESRPAGLQRTEMCPHERGENAYNLKQEIQNNLLNYPDVSKALAKLAFEPRGGIFSDTQPYDGLGIYVNLRGVSYTLVPTGWVGSLSNPTLEGLYIIRNLQGEEATILNLSTEYMSIGGEKYFLDGEIRSSKGYDQDVLDTVRDEFPELFT